MNTGYNTNSRLRAQLFRGHGAAISCGTSTRTQQQRRHCMQRTAWSRYPTRARIMKNSILYSAAPGVHIMAGWSVVRRLNKPTRLDRTANKKVYYILYVANKWSVIPAPQEHTTSTQAHETHIHTILDATLLTRSCCLRTPPLNRNPRAAKTSDNNRPFRPSNTFLLPRDHSA